MPNDSVTASLDVTAPGFRFQGAEFEAARERSWAAMSPVGLIVMRYAEAAALIKHRDIAFNGAQQMSRNGISSGPLFDWWSGAMFTASKSDHARLRGLLSQSFTPRLMESFRPFCRDAATRLCAAVTDGPTDFVATVADPYPALIVSELLGVPAADYDVLSRWTKDFSLSLAPNLAQLVPQVDEAVAGLSVYVADLIDRRRGSASDDLISRLIRSEAAGELTAAELHSMVMLLIWGGIDTAAHQLSQLAFCFSEHPDQWRLLQQRPELIPQAVDEVCRYQTAPFTAPMFAEADIEFQDVQIAAGTFVMIPFGAVNRDHRAFDDPNRFDVTARRTRPPMLFGGGAHYCLGAVLAKIELVEALSVLTEQFEPPVLTDSPTWTHPMAPLQGPDKLPLRLARR